MLADFQICIRVPLIKSLTVAKVLVIFLGKVMVMAKSFVVFQLFLKSAAASKTG